MTDKDHSDQREYTALSSNALAIQIQAMSTFPEGRRIRIFDII